LRAQIHPRVRTSTSGRRALRLCCTSDMECTGRTRRHTWTLQDKRQITSRIAVGSKQKGDTKECAITLNLNPRYWRDAGLPPFCRQRRHLNQVAVAYVVEHRIRRHPLARTGASGAGSAPYIAGRPQRPELQPVAFRLGVGTRQKPCKLARFQHTWHARAISLTRLSMEFQTQRPALLSQ